MAACYHALYEKDGTPRSQPIRIGAGLTSETGVPREGRGAEMPQSGLGAVIE